LASLRRCRYQLLGSDCPSIDDDTAWGFLEKRTGEEGKDPSWHFYRQSATSKDAPLYFEMPRGMEIDNARVIAGNPVSGIHHPYVPVSMLYV
jgi:hypothetical protein